MPPPITEDQKSQIVSGSGYDPSRYTTDDTGYRIISKPAAEQPSGSIGGYYAKAGNDVTTTPSIGGTKNSALETYTKSLAQRIPSALSGAAGIGIGTALAPETGGLSYLIPILSGMAGGYLGGKAQEAIEPSDWTQSVVEAEKQHPVAALAGSLSSIPFSGFYPSPKNIVRSAQGLAELGSRLLPFGRETTSLPIDPNNLRALGGAGFGAGLNTVQDIVMSMLQGHGMPGASDLAKSAAIGALFSTPNALGRKVLGGIPEGDIQVEPDAAMYAKAKESTNEQPPAQPTPPLTTKPQPPIPPAQLFDPSRPAPSISGLTTTPLDPVQAAINRARLASQLSSSGVMTPNVEVNPKTGEKTLVKPEPYRPPDYEPAKPGREEEEGTPAQFYPSEGGAEQFVPTKSAAESGLHMDQLLREKEAAEAKVAEQEAAQKKAEQEAAAKQKAIQDEQIAQQKVADIQQKALERAKQRAKQKAKQQASKAPKAPPIIQQPGLSPDELLATEPSIPSEEQKVEKPKTALQKAVKEEIEDKDLPTEETPDLVKFFHKLGLIRGYEFNEDGNLQNTKTGEVIAGRASGLNALKQGLRAMITLNPNMKGADVRPHETLHVLMKSLEDSPRPRDQKFINDFYKAVEKLPEYQEWAQKRREYPGGALDDSPNEYIATNEGINAYRRAVGADNETPMKKWARDFGAYIKVRYSKHATAEDYGRLLRYKLYRDPAYFDFKGVPKGAAVLPGDEKHVEEPAIPFYKGIKRSEPISDEELMSHRTDAYNRMKQHHEDMIDTLNSVRRDYHHKVGVDTDIKDILADYKNNPEGLRLMLEDNLGDYSANDYMDRLDKSTSGLDNAKAALRDLSKLGRGEDVAQNAEEPSISRQGGEDRTPRDEDRTAFWKLVNAGNESSKEFTDVYKDIGDMMVANGRERPSTFSIFRGLKSGKWRDDIRKIIGDREADDVFDRYDKAKSIVGKSSNLATDLILPGNEEKFARNAEQPSVPSKEPQEPEKIRGKLNARHIDNQKDITNNIASVIDSHDEMPLRKLVEAKSDLIDNYNWDSLPRTEAFLKNDLKPQLGVSWQLLRKTLASELAQKRNIPEPEAPIVSKEEGKRALEETRAQVKAAKQTSKEKELSAAGEEAKEQKIKARLTAKDLARQQEDRELEEKNYQKLVAKAQDVGQAKPSLQQTHALNQIRNNIDSGNLSSAKENLKKEWTKIWYDWKDTPPENERARYVLSNHVMNLRLLQNELRKKGIDVPFETPIYEKGETGGLMSYAEEPSIPSRGEPEDKEAILPSVTSLMNRLLQKNQNAAPLSYSTFHFTEPQMDVIRKRFGDDIADALTKLLIHSDENYGKGMYPIVSALSKMKLQDVNRVEDILINENRDKRDYSNSLNANQRTLYRAVRDSLKEEWQDRVNANQPVTDKNGKKVLPTFDPYYYPNRPDPDVLEKISSRPGSPEGKKLINDFLDLQVNKLGKSQDEANKILNRIKNSFEAGRPNLTRFHEIRELERTELPDSWLSEKGLAKNMHQFYSRVSRDRAWHDNIESDPDIASRLGIRKDPWGKDNPVSNDPIQGAEPIKDFLEKMKEGGGFDKDERLLKAMNRVATSGMLGPLTNIHIGASSLFNSLNYTKPIQGIKAATYALTHMGASYQKILKNGYYKKDFDTIRDILDTHNTGVERMSALAKVIGDLNGRTFTEKFVKSYLQGFGEYAARSHNIFANNGSETSTDFMKHLDPDWTSGKRYTDEEFSKLGSQFGQLVHGGHDARTMPGWLLKETALQPFIQLMSWNVGQTNAWMRHVYTPAKNGDFTPLIMSSLGALGGGLLIKEAREQLTRTKAPYPGFTELMKSDRGMSPDYMLHNAAALASYTGYGGIMSVAAKAMLDILHKNIPQGATFPLDEFISGNMERAAKFAQAAYNDPSFNLFDAGGKFALDTVKENVQALRLATTWAAKAGMLPYEEYSKQLSQKESDLRRYKMAEGLPYETQTGQMGNPYMDLGLKEFKRTTNLGEAIHDIPSLISKAFHISKGNPEILKEQIQKIKENNYETMPNPNKVPLSFYRYLSYLGKTQGPEEASNRFMDYMRHNIINQAKESMVPSF